MYVHTHIYIYIYILWTYMDKHSNIIPVKPENPTDVTTGCKVFIATG